MPKGTYRIVPPGTDTPGIWSGEFPPELLSGGQVAFVFPTIHRRRQVEEYFLARNGALPVRLFTPRQFAESVAPPDWMIAGPFAARLALERVVENLFAADTEPGAHLKSLRAHGGSRRLLLRFFAELAEAGFDSPAAIQSALADPHGDDRTWLPVLAGWYGELERHRLVFAPALEWRLSRWVRQGKAAAPFTAVRVELGAETSPGFVELLDALATAGSGVQVEIPMLPSQASKAELARLPAWRATGRILDRFRAFGHWTELPAAEGAWNPDREALLDPLAEGEIAASNAAVFAGQAEGTPADELHAACERIRRRLDAGEIHPQEAGIVLTNPDALSAQVEGIARRYGFPVEIARARTVAETEPGRAVVSFLAALGSGFEPEPLMDFLSHPLVNWDLAGTATAADEAAAVQPRRVGPALLRDFDEAFDQARAQGGWHLWLPRLQQLAAAARAKENGARSGWNDLPILRAAEALGRLFMGLSGLSAAGRMEQGCLGIRPQEPVTARRFAYWLERVIWNARVSRRLAQLSGNGPEDAAALHRSFSGLTRLFDTLAGAVADSERLAIGERPLRDWAADLDELLHTAAVPEHVPSAKAVRVLSPRDIPGLCLRHLEWTGLSEESFPGREPDPVWGSPDARRRLGLDAGTSGADLAWSRLGLALIETAGPVYLSAPRRDSDRRAVMSSPVWIISERLVGAGLPSISHWNSLVRQSAAWLSGFEAEYGNRPDWPETARAVLFPELPSRWPEQLLVAEPSLDPAAALQRTATHRVSGAFREELAAMLRDRPLSPSRLGEYARCPFFYLAVTRLGARERQERTSGPTPMERGTLIHEVLEEFYRDPEVLDRRGSPDWADAVRPRLMAIFKAKTEGLSRTFHGEAWEIEQDRSRRILDRFLVYESQIAPYSRPVAVELEFGRAGSGPFEWAGLRFSGAIDRVDTVPGRGFFIFDYKTGRAGAGEKELTRGLAFQLPVYAAAARVLLGEEATGGGNWLGGGYYSLRLPETKVTDPLMCAEDRMVFGREGSRTGVGKLAMDLPALEQRYLDRARQIARLVESGSFTTTPLKEAEARCGYCHLKAACHRDEQLREIRNGDRERYGVLPSWDAPAAAGDASGDDA
ncbi:MAG: PD-(D/E)XK nuclease family protein [Deltaproteobacteria bacterium]|nr:PD-(D/E)XK nuclease family protein [Deltaproteobacteria bacterium]